MGLYIKSYLRRVKQSLLSTFYSLCSLWSAYTDIGKFVLFSPIFFCSEYTSLIGHTLMKEGRGWGEGANINVATGYGNFSRSSIYFRITILRVPITIYHADDCTSISINEDIRFFLNYTMNISFIYFGYIMVWCSRTSPCKSPY